MWTCKRERGMHTKLVELHRHTVHAALLSVPETHLSKSATAIQPYSTAQSLLEIAQQLTPLV